MASILVTGAKGFIGRALVETLSGQGHKVYPAGRATPKDTGSSPQWRYYDLGAANPDFNALLDGIDTVIHLAAHVHVRGGSRAAPANFRLYNTDATAKLIEASVAAGVKRFVYLSSIGVNGNG
ncbi:MAG: NAD-dependent epimerase/dehydratase family protein, partial [Gammaproteobacteria bacterium]